MYRALIAVLYINFRITVLRTPKLPRRIVSVEFWKHKMTSRTFVAFSSIDSILADTITSACEDAQRPETIFDPWNRNDPSGNPIDRSVFNWVEDADAIVADISEPNHNVTYEIGLAIGMRKPIRLIRASNKDLKPLTSVGLLQNIGHNKYEDRTSTFKNLGKGRAIRCLASRKAESRTSSVLHATTYFT